MSDSSSLAYLRERTCERERTSHVTLHCYRIDTRGGKIVEIPSFDKKFSGMPSKNISFAATFYWNSINSSLILAASTPVVSSCQSSAPPPSSVNDGSLPANINEDDQQRFGTYKISSTSLVHTCICLLLHLRIR